MADIFISYAKKDRDAAQRLAGALEAQGWSVWWDRELVGGVAFDKEIETQLDSARCVIVGWSGAALNSEWVRDEAEDARSRGVIVPVLFEQVRVPLRFRRIHTVDMSDWDGDAESAPFQSLAGAVRRLVEPSQSDVANDLIARDKAERKAEEEQRRRAEEKQEPKPAAVEAKRVKRKLQPEKKKPRSAPKKKSQPRRSKQEPLTVCQDTLKDGSEGPTMVVIPAGSFLMGAPKKEIQEAKHDGSPQHLVNFNVSG